jgi:hypothetical protein
MEKWTSDFEYADNYVDFISNKVGALGLLKHMLKQKTGFLTSKATNGNFNPEEKSAQEHIKHVEDLNGRLIYRDIDSNGLGTRLFVFDNGILEFSIRKNYLSIEGISSDEAFLNDLVEHFKQFFIIIDVPVGQVHAIVNYGGHLRLSSIGTAGIELKRNNYSKEVLAGYDHVVEDLKAESPTGRVSIFEGSPGTGKTFLVKSLLLDLPDAAFILVSPDMVATLSGPELLPLLVNHRYSHSTGPIILVLEDSDKCLVKRAADNMSSIQALLNLGDGILGSMLDIRIIATTNATKLDIEPAILRPGRLSARVEVKELSSDFAINLFKSLVPGKELHYELKNGKDHSLAEVYSFARECGWVPEKRKEKDPDDDEDDEDYDD